MKTLSRVALVTGLALLASAVGIARQSPPQRGGGAPGQTSTPPPAGGAAAPAQAPAPADDDIPRPLPGMKYVGTMSDLMIDMIYPTSDAILYITSRTPTNDVEWNELRAKALILAESGNILMLPGRARDQGKWMEYSKMMLDAGQKAFAAAKKHDADAIAELNDQLYQSCLQCHALYRRNYGRGR